MEGTVWSYASIAQYASYLKHAGEAGFSNLDFQGKIS
jgi:hypothetical protein